MNAPCTSLCIRVAYRRPAMRLYSQESSCRQFLISCCCKKAVDTWPGRLVTVSRTTDDQSTSGPSARAAHSPQPLSLDGLNGSMRPSRLMTVSIIVFPCGLDRADWIGRPRGRRRFLAGSTARTDKRLPAQRTGRRANLAGGEKSVKRCVFMQSSVVPKSAGRRMGTATGDSADERRQKNRNRRKPPPGPIEVRSDGTLPKNGRRPP